MLENQEFEVFTVRRIITIVNFQKSMELSFVELYNKVITIQGAHDKDKILFYFCDS